MARNEVKLRNRHRRHPAPKLEQSKCYLCQRAEAVCKSKISWYSPQDAHDAAVQFNVEKKWVKPVISYWCPNCCFWHLTTAKQKHQMKRAESWRRRWLIAQL